MEQEYNYQIMEQIAKIAKNYFTKNNVESSIKVSRYRKEIKALEIFSALPIEEVLNTIKLPASVSDLQLSEEKAISGKYKTKLVTVLSVVPGFFNKGDKFFLLNRFTEKGTLKNKQVAPEKIGIVGQRFRSLSDFDSAVFKGIDSLSAELSVKKALSSLFRNIQKGGLGNSISYTEETQEILRLIKPQDRQAIGKDFGEVLSLRWYAANFPGWDDFGFSTVSNAPLVDYSLRYDKKNVNVSAKFEQGAAPSITAILAGIEKAYPTPTLEERKAINTLKALGSGSGTTSTKILGAFKELNLPAYTQLQKILNKNSFTLEDISNKIKESVKAGKTKDERISHFSATFGSFYDVLGKTVDKSSLETVFLSTVYSKYFSLILSPMGYSLVSYLNFQPIYQDILNNASRTLDVEQIYISFGQNSIDLKKKLFSKSKYKFSYGANAKNSDNTGIKFEMLKT